MSEFFQENCTPAKTAPMVDGRAANDARQPAPKCLLVLKFLNVPSDPEVSVLHNVSSIVGRGQAGRGIPQQGKVITAMKLPPSIVTAATQSPSEDGDRDFSFLDRAFLAHKPH
jgi:hypothetical protein